MNECAISKSSAHSPYRLRSGSQHAESDTLEAFVEAMVTRLPGPARRDNMRPAMNSGSGYTDEGHGPAQDDLRHRIATALQHRAAVLVWDTVAIFPFSGAEVLAEKFASPE